MHPSEFESYNELKDFAARIEYWKDQDEMEATATIAVAAIEEKLVLGSPLSELVDYRKSHSNHGIIELNPTVPTSTI